MKAPLERPGGHLRIVYVGETWQGSSARSMREALARSPAVVMDEIGEDHYLPRHRMWPLRVVHRLLNPLYRADLRREVKSRCAMFRPDVLMVYKGSGVGPEVVDWARASGMFTVNVFPDCSPHAHGARLKEAMGHYDLVVSAKPYHPVAWGPVYGYRNRCVCVPHGYDLGVHYWPEPPDQQDIDVVLAARWRPQYEALMLDVARGLGAEQVRVALAGLGWAERRHLFPGHWEFPGAPSGRAYGELVRRGRIVVAPVHRELFVDGVQQPGDEDTTRTYELAAAGCFFLHRRTPFARQLYDEATEVPMWDDAAELCELIRTYLPLGAARREMAAKAHRRAVPDYSIPARAGEVLSYVQEGLTMRAGES